MGFLTEHVERVREDLKRNPLDESALMGRVGVMPAPRDFAGALRGDRPAVIAEIKRASPSAGAIVDLDPGATAAALEDAGAAALSVLTEPRHFDGSPSDLRAAHLKAKRLPILRKDFLVHPAQLMEARAAGADAVLLITACLTVSELRGLLETAADLDLAALVETHSDEDLDKALAANAAIVGVNSRDLETLEVDEDRALALAQRIPQDRTIVFESGISTRAQVERALDAGADAILVGEALMRAKNPAAKLRQLRGELAPVAGLSAHDQESRP